MCHTKTVFSLHVFRFYMYLSFSMYMYYIYLLCLFNIKYSTAVTSLHFKFYMNAYILSLNKFLFSVIRFSESILTVHILI